MKAIAWRRTASRTGSAVALDELDRGQERAALVAIGQRVVLDEMPAEHRSLRREVRIGLETAEPCLRGGQRGIRQTDPIELGDELGRLPQGL